MATPSRSDEDTVAAATHSAPPRARSLATTTAVEHVDDAEPPLLAGTTLDRFEILGLLGEGGMGRVYRAHDPQLRRDVALKLLQRSTAPNAAARLLREARAMARLCHPNLLPIFDVGRHVDGLFIAMELVEGQTLAEWLRAASRPPAEVLPVLVAAGRGLAAAHAAGLVHRDFKPSNVMLGHDGRVRVMDLGLARLTSDGSASDVEAMPSASSLEESLTRPGEVAGSPPYMAPEQHRGEPTDARCDQYAFCVVLWEALAGRRPFVGSYGELVAAKLRGPPDPSAVTRLPRRLHRLLRRGLAVDPRDRFATTDELLRRLDPPRTAGSRRAIAAAGLGLLCGGLALSMSDAWAEPPCQGAAARLAGAWDTATRERLQAAVLTSGVPHAVDTWERLAPRLDHYAARWIHDRTDACEATHVRHEQSEAVMDARMRCLDGHRRELVALVHALEAADGKAVGRAVQAAERLPRLERCADVERVTHEAPPPDDPRVGVEVDAVREELAEAAAMHAAQRLDDATAVAAGLLARAQALGYEPLVAEVALRLGQWEGEAGRHEPAVEALTQAYFTAERWGQHDVQTQAAIALVYAQGLLQPHHEAALQWSKHAEALVDRLGDDERRSELLATTAGVRQAQARYDEALALLQAALELRLRLLGPEHVDVAQVLNNIGIVEHSRGRYDAALASFEDAQQLQERALGPRHPQTASTLGNVGAAYEALGRYPEALASYRRALVIKEELLGEAHPTVAVLLNNIGIVLEAQGELGPALEHYERARALRERTLGLQHPDTATSIDSVAGILGAQGRHEDAEPLQRRALAIREEALGPEHPETAVSLSNLGSTLLARARLDEAERLHRRALAIRERALGPEHPSVSSSLTHLALVLRAQGRLDEARASLERARAILETAMGPEHPKLAEVLRHIADLQAP